MQCSLDTCEKRDPKGLYKKARNGEIPSFTGIGSPYEEPEKPEIIVNTEEYTIEETADFLINYLKGKQLV